MDVQHALDTGYAHELWAVHTAAEDRAIWESAIETARADGNPTNLATAEKALAELPAITALQALTVGHRLAGLLTGRRWLDMQRAREQGASWAEIGAALDMSKQGAQDWYQRRPMTDHTDRDAARRASYARARLCAHADQDGRGMHVLEPGETCPDAVRPMTSSPRPNIYD